MSRIQRSAIVPYSAQQMFDLINDIPAYPQFMRGCVAAQVLERGDNWLLARLDLARAGIKQSFTTRNTLDPPRSVKLALHEGPFTELHGEWCFEALAEDACKVELCLVFHFANTLVGLAAGKLFEQVASDQVEVICRRARAIYG